MRTLAARAPASPPACSFTLPALLREHAYFNSPPKQVLDAHAVECAIKQPSSPSWHALLLLLLWQPPVSVVCRRTPVAPPAARRHRRRRCCIIILVGMPLLRWLR